MDKQQKKYLKERKSFVEEFLPKDSDDIWIETVHRCGECGKIAVEPELLSKSTKNIAKDPKRVRLTKEATKELNETMRMIRNNAKGLMFGCPCDDCSIDEEDIKKMKKGKKKL